MVKIFEKDGKQHEIELFDSIHNIPILRFQKLNKYTMIDMEIGSDFADYEKRTEKALAFLYKGMVEEAKQELLNRRLLVYNAYNEQSPKGKSFACLVQRIDDVHYKKFSPTDLDEILIHLNNIGFDAITSVELLRDVKKNSKRNWSHISQSIFQKGKIWRNWHSGLKGRTKFSIG